MNNVPRFDAGYVVLGKGKRAGEINGIEIIDANAHLGGLGAALPQYLMYQTWVVNAVDGFVIGNGAPATPTAGTAYSTGSLNRTFADRFAATKPGDTLKYRNWTYRRLTEQEVDDLNLLRLKSGGLLLR